MPTIDPARPMEPVPLAQSRLFLWLWMVLVMVDSGFVFSIIYPSAGPLSLFLLSSMLLLVYVQQPKRLDAATTLVLALVVLTGLGFFANASFATLQSLSDYASFMLLIICAFLLGQILSFAEIVRCYLRLLRWISIFALVGYVAILGLGLATRLPVVASHAEQYFNGFLFVALLKAPDRLTGLFWEPGVFQSYLYLGLILECFYVRNRSWLNLALFLICSLLTFSTTAYYLLPMLALLGLSESSMRKSFWFCVAALAVAGAIYLLNFEAITVQLARWFPSVFVKMLSDNDSVLTRQYSIYADWRLFLHDPLWGVGRQNLESQAQFIYRAMGITIDSRTSTITAFLASMGAPFTLCFCLGLFKAWSKLVRTVSAKIIISIIIAIIVTMEPFMNSLFLWVVLFSLNRRAPGSAEPGGVRDDTRSGTPGVVLGGEAG